MNSVTARPLNQQVFSRGAGVITVLRWLRAAALVGQCLTIAIAYWLYEGRLALQPLLWVVIGYAAWSVLFYYRTRSADLGRTAIAFELVVDLIALTALFYFAGGWTNPFVSVYLVPLAFAAAVLELRFALGLAALALALYAVIVRFQHALPSVHGRFGGDFNLHVLGMWMSFVISTIVLATAISFVRNALEQQRLALARERESRMRDEQLVALGALAASTAHELGGPLSTARLIAEELDGRATGGDRVQILLQQIDYAIGKLRTLVGVANASSDDGATSLTEMLQRIIDRYRTLRPEIDLSLTIEPLPKHALADTRLLESAILALLVNAANASAEQNGARVLLTGHVKDTRFIVTIRDFGSGLEAHPLLGQAVVSSKRGLGMGLAISSATFERYGGAVEYVRRDPGTELIVSLPLAALYRRSR